MQSSAFIELATQMMLASFASTQAMILLITDLFMVTESAITTATATTQMAIEDMAMGDIGMVIGAIPKTSQQHKLALTTNPPISSSALSAVRPLKTS